MGQQQHSALRPNSAQFCDQEYSYDYIHNLAGSINESYKESQDLSENMDTFDD